MSRSADLRLQRTFYVIGFKFGIDEYNVLLAFQQGGCGICGKKPTKIRLSVDHEHSGPRAGLLRGLLCMRCNRGYGLFHDNDSTRLRKAANYLDNPPFVQLFGVKKTAPGRLGTKLRARLLKQMMGECGQGKTKKRITKK